LDTKSRQDKSQSTRQKARIPNISSTDLPALLALALGRSAAMSLRRGAGTGAAALAAAAGGGAAALFENLVIGDLILIVLDLNFAGRRQRRWLRGRRLGRTREPLGAPASTLQCLSE